MNSESYQTCWHSQVMPHSYRNNFAFLLKQRQPSVRRWSTTMRKAVPLLLLLPHSAHTLQKGGYYCTFHRVTHTHTLVHIIYILLYVYEVLAGLLVYVYITVLKGILTYITFHQKCCLKAKNRSLVFPQMFSILFYILFLHNFPRKIISRPFFLLFQNTRRSSLLSTFFVCVDNATWK